MPPPGRCKLVLSVLREHLNLQNINQSSTAKKLVRSGRQQDACLLSGVCCKGRGHKPQQLSRNQLTTKKGGIFSPSFFIDLCFQPQGWVKQELMRPQLFLNKGCFCKLEESITKHRKNIFTRSLITCFVNQLSRHSKESQFYPLPIFFPPWKQKKQQFQKQFLNSISIYYNFPGTTYAYLPTA